jgi:hypothetical protein
VNDENADNFVTVLDSEKMTIIENKLTRLSLWLEKDALDILLEFLENEWDNKEKIKYDQNQKRLAEYWRNKVKDKINEGCIKYD